MDGIAHLQGIEIDIRTDCERDCLIGASQPHLALAGIHIQHCGLNLDLARGAVSRRCRLIHAGIDTFANPLVRACDLVSGHEQGVFVEHFDVIAHAERLCESVAIVAKGKIAFDGRVDDARAKLSAIVRLRTRASDGPWRSAIPAGARREGDEWVFELPAAGPEPLLRALIDGGAGIETLAIERPGLHDAFVAIAGSAAAAAMGQEKA